MKLPTNLHKTHLLLNEAAPAGGGGAPAAPAAAAPAAAPALAAVPDWTAGFAEETRGYIQNKGWKGAEPAIDSYRNLEKLHGVPPEQIVKLPKDGSDKAAWDAVYAKLGRPETADKYNIPMPKEGGSPEFAKWAQQNLFEQGISAKAGEALIGKYNEYVAQTTKAAQDARQVANINSANELKKEWGAAHDQEVEVAKRACATFGVEAAVVDKIQEILGFAETMKMFNKIGRGLGEDKFVDGGQIGNPNQPATPEAAKSRLNELMADKSWSAKYLAGDSDARGLATHLLKMANPEQK